MTVERESDAWPELPPVVGVPSLWSADGLRSLRVQSSGMFNVIVMRVGSLFYTQNYNLVMGFGVPQHREGLGPGASYEWRAATPLEALRGPLLVYVGAAADAMVDVRGIQVGR